MIDSILMPFDQIFMFPSYGRKPKSILDKGKRFRCDAFVNISVCRKCGVDIDRQHEYCKKCFREEITK